MLSLLVEMAETSLFAQYAIASGLALVVIVLTVLWALMHDV